MLKHAWPLFISTVNIYRCCRVPGWYPLRVGGVAASQLGETSLSFPGWYPLRMSEVAASRLGKTSLSFPAFRACGCPAYLLATVCNVVLHLPRTPVWDVYDPLPHINTYVRIRTPSFTPS